MDRADVSVAPDESQQSFHAAMLNHKGSDPHGQHYDGMLDPTPQLDQDSPGHEGEALAIDFGIRYDQGQDSHPSWTSQPFYKGSVQDEVPMQAANATANDDAQSSQYHAESRSATPPASMHLDSNQHEQPTNAPSKVAEHVRPGAAALVASQGQGKKKSHARKQPKGHIPRPRNAFILFRKHITDNNLIPTTVEVKHQNVSVIASKMWAEAPPEVKAEFVEAARIEKEEHARKYPNYRYQPAYRRTDIIRRRVRKDPDEEEKCEAVASLLMEGKVGKKLETEIRQVISKPGTDAATSTAKKGRRRKDTPGELSKGALRAQRAQARAKALRENWLETTVLAANQHQRAVLHAEQERMYQQMQHQQMMDGYGAQYYPGEPIYDPYGQGGFQEDPYRQVYPAEERLHPHMTRQLDHGMYGEPYHGAYLDDQVQYDLQDQPHPPFSPLDQRRFGPMSNEPYLGAGHNRTLSHHSQSRAPLPHPSHLAQGFAPEAAEMVGHHGVPGPPPTSWQDADAVDRFGVPQHIALTPRGTQQFADQEGVLHPLYPSSTRHEPLDQQDFDPMRGPAELIAGAWKHEQPHFPASGRIQPQDQSEHGGVPVNQAPPEFLPLLEGDHHAHPQEIDFGDKGELFEGMLGLREQDAELGGGLDDYQSAVRQQEEMDLGLQRL